MLNLRPYQREAVDSITAYFEENAGNPLVVIPTAGGKSLVIATFVQEALEAWPDTRILILTHVKELIAQNHAELMGHWPQAPAGIYSAGLKRREIKSQILFAGIQSIHRRAYDLQKVDLVLVDECFTPDTLVATPYGDRAIGDIRPGDRVCNAIGIGTVRAISRKTTRELYEVRLTNGTILRCTGNHPFFTEAGWVEARQLERGRRVYRQEDLRVLRLRVQGVDQAGRNGQRGVCHETRPLDEAAILLNLLLQEAEQSDAPIRNAAEDASVANGGSSPTFTERWEWAGPDSGTSNSAGEAGRGLGARVCSSHKDVAWERVSDELQDRHREPRTHDRDRDRWAKPYQSARDGREEGCSADQPRVESVTRVESASDECVCNLDVSGHPSFFAGGVLTHNCHLIPRSADTMYGRFLSQLREINPYIKIIGFTATPFRLDSGMLHEGEDAVFSDIAYDANIVTLIDQGFLCPPVSVSATAQIDTRGVGTRGGEFIAAALEAKATEPAVVEGVVKEIVQHGQDRKGWLVFGVGKLHGDMLLAELQSYGIRAAAIYGDTPNEERDRLIQEFKDQKLRALVSVGVLTTGFNARHVDLVAVVRPTKSTGLWIQIVGRGTRLFPGKTDCLVLDFGGNIRRHGPIDRPVVRKQGGDGSGEAPMKLCPSCGEENFIQALICVGCGHEFEPPERMVETAASDLPLLSGLAPPKDEWLSVEDVRYAIHRKDGKPPSLRVTYECGFQRHSEWVCLEHDGYARTKAIRWWQNRAPGIAVPDTVEQAMEEVERLRTPTEIKVRPEGKYTRIVGAKL